MRDFEGRVAVVTGAASGIGQALCARFADEGMKLMMADIDEAGLRKAGEALAERGAVVETQVTDVARSEQVAELAERTLARFGAVHVVCNNAGVFTAGVTWEAPLEDYQWVLGVNVWGVIHGIRCFVPILLEQGGEGHIVNTASMAGLTAMPYAGIYHLSKHAVVALSECLHHELRLAQSQVRVSVLCPEVVATQIHRSDRNRPPTLRPAAAGAPSPGKQLTEQSLSERVERGIPPSVLAERVLRAIREERFYILSEEAWRQACHTRLDDIREARNPTFAPPLD